MKKCDVLIIGCGIAGAIAALESAKKGLQVEVLSAGLSALDSNSAMAQGGIVFEGVADSPQLLYRDIIRAGGGLCSPEAVSHLTELGTSIVKEIFLDDLKLPFNKTINGMHSFAEEGAHSRPRILHYKDQTGSLIMSTLLKKLQKHSNITLYSYCTAVDLITLSHHSKEPTDIYKPSTCVGAYVFHKQTAKVEIHLARETIIASGGLCALYLHTTNPAYARGDGIAMAYRAGARIMNLEYIQFHPTALYSPTEERFLLSEALRGEGAELLDSELKPFMSKYHADKNLAPRDIVSRSIFTEMLQSQAEHLWLDISFKGKAWLKERFPLIYFTCLEKGIDISEQPIPIVPAAHYSCGGIAIDNYGKTTIHRLRAIGEVSCSGLHGANRLASTSLLEGLVWGKTTADDLVQELTIRQDYFPQVEEWFMSMKKIDSALIHQDWMTIKQTMWNYVGLIRDNTRLQRALKMLRELKWEIESFYEQAALTPEIIGLRNGILTALLIVQGAQQNKRSVGCHYRLN